MRVFLALGALLFLAAATFADDDDGHQCMVGCGDLCAYVYSESRYIYVIYLVVSRNGVFCGIGEPWRLTGPRVAGVAVIL